MKWFLAKVKGLAKPSARINTSQKEETGESCKEGLVINEPVVKIQSCYNHHHNPHAEYGM
jgi:hypothetical protein